MNIENVREPGDEATKLKEVDTDPPKEVCASVHAKIFQAFTFAWTYLLIFILGYPATCIVFMAPLVFSDNDGN